MLEKSLDGKNVKQAINCPYPLPLLSHSIAYSSNPAP